MTEFAGVGRPASHLRVALAAWLSRGTHAVCTTLSIALLLEHLGPTRYAAHVLVVGAAGWLLLGDLGLRNAAQNGISALRARGLDEGALVRSALLAVWGLTPVWALLVWWWAPWVARALLSELSASNLDPVRAVRVAGLLGVLTSSGNLAFNVLYAERRGHLAAHLASVASVAGLGLVFSARALRLEPALELQLLAVMGPAALASLGASAMLWRRTRPARAEELGGAARALLPIAWQFSKVAFLSTALLQVDIWILARAVPAEGVVAYAVASRPFDLGRMAFTGLLQALRPEWTHAVVARDRRRFERLLHRYAWLGVLSMGAIGFTVAAAPELVSRTLSGGVSSLPASMFLAFAAFELVRTWANAHFMGLIAMGELSALVRLLVMQVVLLGVAESVCVAAQGVVGAPIGATVAYLAVSAWAAPRALRRGWDVRTPLLRTYRASPGGGSRF